MYERLWGITWKNCVKSHLLGRGRRWIKVTSTSSQCHVCTCMQVCERFSWLLLFRFKCSFKNIKFTSGRSFIEGGRKTGVTGEKSLNLVFVICDPSWARTHCPSSYKLGKINQRKVRNRFRLSYVGPRYLMSLPVFYLLFMWSLIFIRKLLL